MSFDEGTGEGLRQRLARQGEDTLGKIAQELLENPLVSGALARAFEARERAVQAQEAAMGALNLPSAADIERLTRRLRSVSQRLEGIEDAVDRLDSRLGGADRGASDERLRTIEQRLAAIDTAMSEAVAALASLQAAGAAPAKRAPARRSAPSKPATGE